MKKNAGAASFKYKRHGMRMVPQRLEKVFETACAAEGAKSLQNRWDVTVCPNIVAQIGQHIKHTWPTIASRAMDDELPKRTSATIRDTGHGTFSLALGTGAALLLTDTVAREQLQGFFDRSVRSDARGSVSFLVELGYLKSFGREYGTILLACEPCRCSI